VVGFKYYFHKICLFGKVIVDFKNSFRLKDTQKVKVRFKGITFGMYVQKKNFGFKLHQSCFPHLLLIWRIPVLVGCNVYSNKRASKSKLKEPPTYFFIRKFKIQKLEFLFHDILLTCPQNDWDLPQISIALRWAVFLKI